MVRSLNGSEIRTQDINSGHHYIAGTYVFLSHLLFTIKLCVCECSYLTCACLNLLYIPVYISFDYMCVCIYHLYMYISPVYICVTLTQTPQGGRKPVQIPGDHEGIELHHQEGLVLGPCSYLCMSPQWCVLFVYNVFAYLTLV